MPTRSRARPLYPRVRLQYRDGSGHMRDSSKSFKPKQVLGSFPSPMSERDCATTLHAQTSQSSNNEILPVGSYSLTQLQGMFPPGLEPGTFRVLGERDNHYTTETGTGVS